jgi:hypothetical protein
MRPRVSSESYSAMYRKSIHGKRVSFSLELVCGVKWFPFIFHIQLVCLHFSHPDKFREIYNFAFTWAREKVSLNCRIFLSVFTVAARICWSLASFPSFIKQYAYTDIFYEALCNIFPYLTGSKVSLTGDCHWDVAVAICWKELASSGSLVPVFTGIT